MFVVKMLMLFMQCSSVLQPRVFGKSARKLRTHMSLLSPSTTQTWVDLDSQMTLYLTCGVQSLTQSKAVSKRHRTLTSNFRMCEARWSFVVIGSGLLTDTSKSLSYTTCVLQSHNEGCEILAMKK